MSNDTSKYEKAFNALKLAIDNQNEGERANALSSFLKIWAKNSDKTKFSDFYAWLEQNDYFSNDSEKLRAFLIQSSEELEKNDENNSFSTQAKQYFEALDQKVTQAENKAIMNDVLSVLRTAEKEHKAKQTSSAKIFTEQAESLMAEYNITAEQVREYKKLRQEAMITLFQKADILAKISAESIKTKLEEEFSEIANEYGFLIQNPDGSAQTTDEFSEEYETYCLDRDAYLKKLNTSKDKYTEPKKTRTKAKKSIDPDEEADKGSGPNEPFEDPLTPEPEPITHVETFPIRDADGSLSAFISAGDYTKALTDYISTYTFKNSPSLSIDFKAEAIEPEEKTMQITQHSPVTGWEINNSTNLTWTSSSAEIPLNATTLKTKKGTITVGSANELTVEMAEGEFKALADLEQSNITIQKGSAKIAGSISGGTYKLSNGSLSVDSNIEGTKISISGNSTFKAKGSIKDTEIAIGKDTKAELRGAISGGTIAASSHVEFMNKSVKARDTIFKGHIPSSPLLQPSDFQILKNKNNIEPSQQLVAKMPELFFEAIGMGRPEKLSDRHKIYSPLFWRTRVIGLGGAETSFIRDLMFGLNNGLETPLINVDGSEPEQKKGILAVQQFLEKNKAGQLIVFPIFKNKETATTALKNPKKSSDLYHYRLAFVTKRKGSLNLNREGLFCEHCDNTGYPRGFWKKFGSALYLDISTPSAFDTKINDTVHTAPESLAKEICDSVWVQKKNNLFDESKSRNLPVPTNAITNGKVSIPFSMHFGRYDYSAEEKPTDKEERPNYNRLLKGFEARASAISRDWEAIPVLRSPVFQKCTFDALKTDFYTDNLVGITLSQFTGTAYAEGDLSKSKYTDKSKININCISDINISGATIDGYSTVKLGLLTGTDSQIQINADELDVSDSSLEVILISGNTISFKKAKLQKAKITIIGAKSIDFTDAEFEDCEITISSVDKAVFTGAKFKGCKISLKSKTAVFKNTKIGGVSKITGQTDAVDFEGAKIGDNIHSSEDTLSYGLQSEQTVFDSAEFGNVVFLEESKIGRKKANWNTTKVTGNISATGKMAKVIYPLFGKAANMDQEITPPKIAGNQAHPARRFSLSQE